MKSLRILIDPRLLLILLTCSSCQSLNKDQIWVGDYANEAVVNRKDEVMYCSEERFNGMTCFNDKNLAIIKYCMKTCDK